MNKEFKKIIDRYSGIGYKLGEFETMLEEFGKYVAEEAYREGMNHGESGRYKDPEDWWNEFINNG